MTTIGPQFSVSARTISQVANEVQVSLLSFLATDHTLSSPEFPYFVRTTPSDFFQMSEIADIFDYYEWRDVIAIYVEDDYGRNGVAVSGDKLAEKRCKISYKAPLSPNMSRFDIIHVLSKLPSMESKVLILHTYADLGLEVFDVAKDIGMMSAGYVWMTTDWLSTVLDTDSYLSTWAIDGIQEVLTLRMYTPASEIKTNLISRWERLTDGKSARGSVGLNAYGLYAYDTVWLLAQAIDEPLTQGTHISFSSDSKLTQLNGKSLNFDSVRIFNEGNLLLNSIFKVNLTGVTGKLKCNSDGCVVNPAYEVVNVIGNGRRKIVKPRGRVYPNDGKPLRIAIPKPFFREILYQVEGTGSMDVFTAALDLLPYSFRYQFIPYSEHQPNTRELVHMVQMGVYDAVAGGIAVTTCRMRMVDFTQPYVESGLSFLVVGVVIWILKHRRNDDFRGPPRKQVVTVLLLSFSTLSSSQREKTVTNLSRFLLVVWLFVVLILNSTYAASLSSILTVEQLSSNINERNIQRSRLVPLNSPEEYEKALINGPEKGGVAALVDDRVDMEIFLSTRCEFTIVGPDFVKIGWAFPFQRDSPLAIDMSTAIIKLSENGELQRIRDKWLKRSPCIKQVESEPGSDCDFTGTCQTKGDCAGPCQSLGHSPLAVLCVPYDPLGPGYHCCYIIA
ncbi:hypothetical protein L6164_003066 [Bauhinia variegata]|uniref:Uncharacterized protein n=1 Tax=Bauhinia variegata TaxID=167791 RepID=A0ACB9Q049_BAUVA|nr:hypothetical protein L6164_003066 [Bauhinia variegata]